MTQLAFFFDSSACSGCKACQAACKDKHHLPVGLLWRRVYEVTGGGWTRSGAAWMSNVFAYNLSISCNHCERPICVEVCPTRAMHKRADGLVVVDQDRCMGCQYCSWACPYDAPQYDSASGHMTKCDFCADNLEAGLPPRVWRPARCAPWTLASGASFRRSMGRLPARCLCRRSFHPAGAADQAASGRGPRGAARQYGRGRRNVKERSLVAFTLGSQMAIGAFWLLGVVNGFSAVALSILTAIMLSALAASFLHLGSPHNAWRAIGGWRSSWLSREVSCAALFTALLGGLTLAAWAQIDLGAVAWLAGLCGLAFMISMTQAYRLRTVPAWNQWATTASFFITTLLLGTLLRGVLTGGKPWLAVFAIGLLGAQQAIGWHGPPALSARADRWRSLILASRLLAAGALVIDLVIPSAWLAWLAAFLLASSGEVLARVLFYEMRKPRSVWRCAAHSTLS